MSKIFLLLVLATFTGCSGVGYRDYKTEYRIRCLNHRDRSTCKLTPIKVYKAPRKDWWDE